MTAKFNRINAISETLGYESPAGGKEATDFQYILKQDDKNPGDCKYTFKRICDESCAFEYTMKQEHKVERPRVRCPYCGELTEYCTCYD